MSLHSALVAGRRIYSQPFEFLWIDSCLSQDASERTDGYFAVMGHDSRSGTFARLPGKLDVTPFLADLCEACRFQLAFDFTIG